MKHVSFTDAFELFSSWSREGATLFINTYRSDGEHRSFNGIIFEVLDKSQTLMIRSGEVEIAVPLSGAEFLLLDERDTDKPDELEIFLQCDWPTGNRIIFSTTN